MCSISRRKSVSMDEDFGSALREWQPLLQILLGHSPSPPSSSSSSPSPSPSPVGSAIHWVRSHGFSAPVPDSQQRRTCLSTRLWRLVPHLLSFKVTVASSSPAHDQEEHVQGEKKKKRPITSTTLGKWGLESSCFLFSCGMSVCFFGGIMCVCLKERNAYLQAILST